MCTVGRPRRSFSEGGHAAPASAAGLASPSSSACQAPQRGHSGSPVEVRPSIPGEHLWRVRTCDCVAEALAGELPARGAQGGAGMSLARLRRFWLDVHLWLGVGLSIPIVLIAISGALLVFHDDF